MRKILLLLMALLLAAPVFGVKAPKHHAHAAVHHAKNKNFGKKRGKNGQFKQASAHKHYKKPALSHAKNPNLPKHRRPKKSKKHKG